MKKTKTFKIGKYSNFGKWRLTLDGQTLRVQGIDWTTDKVLEDLTFHAQDFSNIETFLVDNMTPYYAEKLMQWVNPKHDQNFFSDY